MNIAERVDILKLSPGLFGRHPRWRTEQFALPGEREIHAPGLRPCRQTEVRHLGNTLPAHENVPRLEVAVHDPLLVRMTHPGTDPRKGLHPIPQRRIRLLQPPVEPLAIDQFHRQPKAAVGFPTVENRHHIFVRKGPMKLCLPRKALHRKPLPAIRSKHLDGHIPSHRFLIRLPYRGRTATPQIPMHRITRNLRLSFRPIVGLRTHLLR